MTMLIKIRTVKQHHSNKWTTPVDIHAKDVSLA